jgi:hypothetical protein
VARARLPFGPLLAVALAGSLAADCAGVGAGGAGACQFAYTDQVRDTVVVPELKRALGEGWTAWKAEDPTIFEGRRDVRVQIHLRDELGQLNPPDYELVLDRCGQHLIRSGKCYQPGAGAPACGAW